LIGEARTILKDIDKGLASLKKGVGKIKKPIDDARADIGKVLTRLNQFKAGVDYLIREHGDSPPEGVAQCAQTLNGIIDHAERDFDAATQLVDDKLSTLHDAGATIDGVLAGLGGFIDTIGRLVNELTSGPFKTLYDGLRKVEENLAYLKKAGKLLIRAAFKVVGLDLDRMENGLKRFEARIENFIMKTIKDKLDDAKDKLLAELDKIPAVSEFEQRLSDFEASIEAVRDQIENGLGAQCTKILTSVDGVA
jgi:ABC-type transporter Mla subunit MlaD